jgi:ribose transport system substrate-binding protein
MRQIALLSLGLGLLFGAGCGEKPTSEASPPSGEKTEELHIAVIPKGSTHEFWKSVQAGALDAGREFGVKVTFKGPMKEDDRESQIKVVEDFVTAGVDGIVLAPLDDTALRQPVEAAKRAEIPVVIIDSALKDVEVVSFVATDNFKGGETAGYEMERLLGRKGKVAVLRYQEGSASTREREEGFLQVMRANPDIDVVSENQHAGPTTESAQAKAESLLAPFKKPDGSLAIDGIFCPNESSTFGMLRALQSNGWAGKVRFVGFDASSKLVEALRAGEIDALVVQNPRKMGYLGVKTMVDKIAGKPVEARIDTGATLVTKENMDSDEIRKVLEAPK